MPLWGKISKTVIYYWINLELYHCVCEYVIKIRSVTLGSQASEKVCPLYLSLLPANLLYRTSRLVPLFVRNHSNISFARRRWVPQEQQSYSELEFCRVKQTRGRLNWQIWASLGFEWLHLGSKNTTNGPFRLTQLWNFESLKRAY